MHLLHIDSSIQGERSVSRRLTARAAERWLEAQAPGLDEAALARALSARAEPA